MQERDVLDLALVVVLALLAYVRTYGLADPAATASQIAASLANVDVGVYLVLGGIFGILFVGYLTLYLPRKQAKSSIRQSE